MEERLPAEIRTEDRRWIGLAVYSMLRDGRIRAIGCDHGSHDGDRVVRRLGDPDDGMPVLPDADGVARLPVPVLVPRGHDAAARRVGTRARLRRGLVPPHVDGCAGELPG
jgi:hypothetical protein